MLQHFGATPQEWDWLLSVVAPEDLLPVASNPTLPVMSGSTLKAGNVGKVPSSIQNGVVSGLHDWPSRKSSNRDISKWRDNPDHGISVITRSLRGFDVDVPDVALASEIRGFLLAELGVAAVRVRANSSKFLIPVKVLGVLGKRRIKTRHGLVEFLATGQQFIAAGTHPSGARYEWLGNDFPEIDEEELNRIWEALQTRFGVADPTTSKPSSRLEQLSTAVGNDPVVKVLEERGHIRSRTLDGKLHIVCPFEDQHTTPSSDTDTSTSYFPAHTGGYVQGHFVCMHAHCTGRPDEEFRAAIGYRELEFAPVVDNSETPAVKHRRLQVLTLSQFGLAQPLRWLMRGVLPRAELGMVYGPPGCGKTFFVLDLVCAMVKGLEWRGVARKFTTSGAYIAAEGANGLRTRLLAYSSTFGPIGDGLGVIDAAPNLCNAGEVKALITELRKFANPLDFVVIDTLASVTPGANENSGEEMGKMLDHCKAIHRATGAMVLLIHHSGKDSAKGARGWSGIRGALDVEIEISRSDDNATRCARVTKMKDGEDVAEGMYFKLERVSFPDLATEVDGEPYVPTSCVVRTATRPVKLGQYDHIDLKELVFGVLSTLIGESDSDYEPVRHEVVTAACSQLPNGATGKGTKLVEAALDDLAGECRIINREDRYSIPAPADQKRLTNERDITALGDLADSELVDAIA